MRAISKPTLTIGMVSVPVAVYKATNEQKEFRPRLVHKTCGTPINEVKRCAKCQVDLTQDDVVRAVEAAGKFVAIPDEIPGVVEDKTIDLAGFMPSSEVDPFRRGDAYWLGPVEGSVKSYGLVQAALAKAGLSGIGRRVFRKVDHLVEVRAVGNALAMFHLHYDADLRPSSEIPKIGEVSAQADDQVRQAAKLLRGLPLKGGLEQFTDRRKDAMKALIAQVAPEAVAPLTAGGADDLIKALQASITAAAKPKAGAKS